MIHKNFGVSKSVGWISECIGNVLLMSLELDVRKTVEAVLALVAFGLLPCGFQSKWKMQMRSYLALTTQDYEEP